MQIVWQVNMHTYNNQHCTSLGTCNTSQVALFCTCTLVPVTHPPGFTLVFNRLLGVWYGPLHIVYRVLHIVLYAVYHFPLGRLVREEVWETQKVERRSQVCGQEQEEWTQIERRWRKGKGNRERDNYVTRLLVFLNFLHFGMRSFASSTYSWAPRTHRSMLFTRSPCTNNKKRETVLVKAEIWIQRKHHLNHWFQTLVSFNTQSMYGHQWAPLL